MKLRNSMVTAALFVIAAGCAGFAVQSSNAQQVRSALNDQYKSHYEGQGEGLLALDNNNTLWAIYELAGRAEPTYRVLAITFSDRARPAALPEGGRGLPKRGQIIVNIHPKHRALEIRMPGTRVSFIAAMDDRSMRPMERTPVLHATSFGAATFQTAALDELLQNVSDLTAEAAGDAWPMTLYATRAFNGGLGASGEQDRAPGCCASNVTCISGGPHASSCNLTLGGISFGTTCDAGFYACCCNVGVGQELIPQAQCCQE